MVVGAISSRTELAIIGAGPGGYTAALRAADAGIEVALIDRSDVGGACLNVGCIPSKTLIEAAAARHKALAMNGRGFHASVEVDIAALSAHVRSTTDGLRDGITHLLRAAGVNLIQGVANFARHDRLAIEQSGAVSHLEFDDVIIATGSRPIELPTFAADARTITSTGALSLAELPKATVVIGGGYIGVELGTALAKLGSTVTIVEQSPDLLPGVPRELARIVQRRLSQLGVTVLTATHALEPTASGVLLDTQRELEADAIVIAVGRRPNTDRCSIEVTQAAVDDRGHIATDHAGRAAHHIYAIGDATSGPALAHRAAADAERSIQALTGKPVDPHPPVIPAVVFCDPEVMTVGVSPHEATELDMHVHRFGHSASGRAHTAGDASGVTMIVSDARGTVTGVHVAGPQSSELAGEATLAIELAATVDDLMTTVHAHPTMSETIGEAAMVAGGKPLHIRG